MCEGERCSSSTATGWLRPAGLLYNLACCESLAGRTGDAVDHLGLAIDRSERCRSYAKDDSDFNPIRDEPTFKELIERKG